MLDIRHLRFSYGRHPVLQGVSLRLEQGELVFLLGANGAGKSTLFRCALGLLPGYEGEISLPLGEVRRLSARTLAREIAYIPQNHHPAFSYPVLDMVVMGTHHQLSPFSNPGPREEAVAMEALEQVGIAHLAQRDFLRLSGGEQQLVLIARALAQQAKILLMDEPTSSLDFGNRIRVLDQTAELARRGYAILLSCHDPQLALLYAHRAAALHQDLALVEGGRPPGGRPPPGQDPGRRPAGGGAERGPPAHPLSGPRPLHPHPVRHPDPHHQRSGVAEYPGLCLHRQHRRHAGTLL